MFWHLKNRIKEETGNDVDLIPAVVNSNQTKLNKDKHSRHGSTTSLSSFAIDTSKEEPGLASTLDMKLADGKIITSKEFKRLESKEDEWRRKLQKKEDELILKFKKMEESWKKILEEKEKELKEEIDKKESDRKLFELEKNELRLKNAQLEEISKKATDYHKKICQYQEDIDQLQGFQTQEVAKIKHLLLVQEQELVQKNKLLQESNAQLNSLKLEVVRLRNYEQQYENIQDDIETLRHNFDIEKVQLLSKLAEREEDVRHLKDKVILLEERANAGPINEMTIDERVQKLLGERALFERRLEEAHLHLSQIKSSWSGKIESLETQVGRLCRQASKESADKRQVESERDALKEKLSQIETQLSVIKTENESKGMALEHLRFERKVLEEEMQKLKMQREEEIRTHDEEIKYLSGDSSHLQEQLSQKLKETEEKNEIISNLESKLSEREEEKSLLEWEVKKLKGELENEKRVLNDTSTKLENEQREKDEMMMRNAQISQELEMGRQKHRKQEMELNELVAKIAEFEDKLKKKESDLDLAMRTKSELDSKMRKYEKIEKDHEMASSVEKDLRAKISQLENELFEKNKNVKILQQRLSDIKKTLQRELKVPSASIDPGGTDSDACIQPAYASSNAANVFHPSSAQNSTVVQKFRNDETLDDENYDVTFKYLKHVLIKFLTSRECEAQHLTRAVATLLKFSAEEERLLKETLEWKMSWFGTRPNLGNGQTAKTIPPR